MNKREKDALKKQEALFVRTRKVLNDIVHNKMWLSGYMFTSNCGEMDACGIDIVLSFKCNVNGGTGKLCAQQKPNMSGARGHLVRYPRIPVYILTKYDNLSLIEYTFLTLILECEAYNTGKRVEIQEQQAKLKNKIFDKMDPAQKHKTFLTRRDYEKKIGKKI